MSNEQNSTSQEVTERLVIDVGYFTHNSALQTIKDYLWKQDHISYHVDDVKRWMRGKIYIKVTGLKEDVDEVLDTIENWVNQ